MKRADNRDCMGELQRAEMAFDCRARHADGGGGFAGLQLSAALPENVFKNGVEAVEIAEPEQPLDIPGEKGIQPLALK